MPQITITTDSDELRARIFAYAHAVNSIIDLDLDVDTEVERCEDLAGDLIDKLLEETEENAPETSTKQTVGFSIINKQTRFIQISKIFTSESFANMYLHGHFGAEAQDKVEVVRVYI